MPASLTTMCLERRVDGAMWEGWPKRAGGARGSESSVVNVALTSSISGVSNVTFGAGNAPSKAGGWMEVAHESVASTKLEALWGHRPCLVISGSPVSLPIMDPLGI